MDFVRKGGFSLLGDERVIVGKDKVFSFVPGNCSPSIFQFMTEHLATEESLNYFWKARYLWQALRNKGDKDKYMAKEANLKALLFIIKEAGAKQVTVDPIASNKVRQTVARLTANNRLEDFIRLADLGINSAPFLEYLLAYSFVFPHSSLASADGLASQQLEAILADLPIYQVKRPAHYHPDVFRQIYQLVLAVT